MAASTVIAPGRTQHRAARLAHDAFQGALALDWANGQAIAPISGTSQQSSVFDASNDRIVYVSVGGAATVLGAWIAVGSDPTAAVAAGSMWIAQQAAPVPVYVPKGMKIAGLQGGAAGTLSMVPALVAGNN
jgi:hypothetical protein